MFLATRIIIGIKYLVNTNFIMRFNKLIFSLCLKFSTPCLTPKACKEMTQRHTTVFPVNFVSLCCLV